MRIPTIPHDIKAFLKETSKGIESIWAKFKGRIVRKNLAKAKFIQKKLSNTQEGPGTKRLSERTVQQHQGNVSLGSKRKGFLDQTEGKKVSELSRQEQLGLEAIELIERLNKSLISGKPKQRIAALGALMMNVHDLCFLEKGSEFGADDIGDVLSKLLDSMTIDPDQVEVLVREMTNPKGGMQDLFSVQLVGYYQKNGEPKNATYHISISESLSPTAKECVIMTPIFLRCLSEKVAPDQSDEVMRQYSHMKDPAPSVRQKVFKAMLKIQ